MIIGIGHDLVDIHRIGRLLDRFGNRFINRCFTAFEVEQAERLPINRKPSFLARRFAAKEAAAKALGSGFRGGIRMIDIGVINNDLGAPTLILCGAAANRLKLLLPVDHSCKYHLSLSDEPPYAAAMVVLEAWRDC
jgi:holo-[acyl-carrier protein] synthase